MFVLKNICVYLVIVSGHILLNMYLNNILISNFIDCCNL